jgi:hypothetical protein
MRVPNRWIPILAAAVGVLGGMGGALVGGYISNQGQEQQFENQQEAARVDLRRDAYARYLQEGYGMLFALQLKHARSIGDEPLVTDAELSARGQALVGAQAAVALYSNNSRFPQLTDELLNYVVAENEDETAKRLVEFTNLAKKDLGLSTGE